MRLLIDPIRLAALGALLAAVVGVAAAPAASTGREPKMMAVRAQADSHVTAGTRGANFGRFRRLTIDGRPLTRAYLRFKAEGRGDEVKRVNLLIYSHTRSPLGYQVRLATRSWREGRITFGNAPRPSSRFVSSGPVQARAWKAVEVTSLIGLLEGDLSLVLTTVGTQAISISSRESGLTGPRLVIEYADEEVSDPPAAPAIPPESGGPGALLVDFGV